LLFFGKKVRKRGREKVREREREGERKREYLFFKGMAGALAPFINLVTNICILMVLKVL
jgi:hypothetical protein